MGSSSPSVSSPIWRLREIGFDLYVVLLLAVLSLWLLRRYGRRSLIVYYATAYGVGLVATALAKAFLR